jgi:pimeloyl-ACP methyl ester carboxylesterase
VHATAAAMPRVLDDTWRLLQPLLDAAVLRGIRLVSIARPGYGGSSRRPGRDVASIAVETAAVLDTLGIERFAAAGHSGGGPHALACGALLPGRVTAVACVAGIAPYTDAFDWWAGMQAPGGLRAALDGTAERERFAETDEFDPGSFIEADWAALAGPWADLGRDAAAAGEAWPMGLVDDDVAFVRPWGFGLGDVAAPVLLVQGARDRVVPPGHARWMDLHLPMATLRVLPGEGHVSALDAVPVTLDWILETT